MFSRSFNIRISSQIVLPQNIIFIMLSSFLTSSMYYKFIAFKRNTVWKVFIFRFILVSIFWHSDWIQKLTCLRKLFILHISKNETFLHSIVKTYIIFQSSKTILLFCTSEVIVFTNSLCTFTIVVLNFSMSKVQKKFPPSFFIPVIWKLNTFFISMFYTVIFIIFYH